MIEQGRRQIPRIERSFRTCPRSDGCIENDRKEKLVELDNETRSIFLLSQGDKEANKVLAACIHERFIIREELYPSQNRN